MKVAPMLFLMAAVYSAPNLKENHRDLLSVLCFAAGAAFAIYEIFIK